MRSVGGKLGGCVLGVALLVGAVPVMASCPAAAGIDAADDGLVTALARAAVDATFVADPSDPERDLVTGRERSGLLEDARCFHARLAAAEPVRFERLAAPHRTRRAEALDARARAELAAGRRARAEAAWSRLVEEAPGAELAGGAAVKLAALDLERGALGPAAGRLARLPELDLGTSAAAAPLVERLGAEIDEELEEIAVELPGAAPLVGSTRVRLHPSLENLGLDRVRDFAEWTAGFDHLDDLAARLRLETFGELLPALKNLGADSLSLDAITRLVPHEERVDAVRTEEWLRVVGSGSVEPDGERHVEPVGEGGGVGAAVEARVARRVGREGPKRFEDLARFQQLEVARLARALGRLELDAGAKALGDRTLTRRHALARRLGALSSAPAGTVDAAQHAAARLVAIADVDGNGSLTPLWDDGGWLRPKRPARERDLRAVGVAEIDDDNPRAVADLFERTGLTESSLLSALLRATSDEAGRLDPRAVDELLLRLREDGRATWEAAHRGRGAPGAWEVERDRLFRLSVLRRGDESFDAVLRRHVLPRGREGSESRSRVASLEAALEREALLAELSDLSMRRGDAFVLVDDAGMSAREKLDRVEEIRARLDEIAAEGATTRLASAIVDDLESQGLRFRPGDRRFVAERMRHESLGTIALLFDEGGLFSGVDSLTALHEPGSKLGSFGAGHLACGFGIDVLEPAPGAHAGWRGASEPSETVGLRYHVGAIGSVGAVGPSAGVAAGFRQRSIWKPEIGLDVSALRGLATRLSLSFTRDVAALHERDLDALFAVHERAKDDGRRAFVRSLNEPGAPGEAAAIFAASVGSGEGRALADEESFLLLHDAYEYERERARSVFSRDARRVRFAGVSISAALLGGDVFLLGGPRLALKDYRLFARFVDGADLRRQSDDAMARRVAIPVGALRGRSTERRLTAGLNPTSDEQGRPSVTAERRVETSEGTAAAARRSLGTLAAGTPERARRHAASLIAEDDPARRLDVALQRAGVPLAVEPAADGTALRLVPGGLAPWTAQSFEIYVSDEASLSLDVADGASLSLDVSEDGHPLLSVGALDGLHVDWLRHGRAITRPGEADTLHRLVFSRSPGPGAAAVIAAATSRLRCEVVDGGLVGCARIATGREGLATPAPSPGGAEGYQDPAVTPGATPAVTPGVTLVAHSSESAAAPRALDPRLVRRLRSATPEEVASFKEHAVARSIRRAAGEAPAGLAPRNVAWIQEQALAVQGRPLEGAALRHAHFLLTHEGLHRADRGDLGEQLAAIERRALPAFAPAAEIDAAADERTRRLLALAGIDSARALRGIRDGVSSMVAEARAGGRLRTDRVARGTRIVTASRAGACRGVQWTWASEAVDAHLLDPFPLTSEEGAYVAAVGLGPELDALARAIEDQLRADGHGDGGAVRIDADRDLVPALAAALAAPRDATTLVLDVADATVTISLAGEPRAGTLSRCKNATIFLPPWGALLETTREEIVAAPPAVTIGKATTDSVVAGRSRFGWRWLTLLGGVPFLLDDDDPAGPVGGGGPDDPDPSPDPRDPRDGVRPAGRDRVSTDPPGRPPGSGEVRDPTQPRDGSGVAGGRGGRPDPPEPPDPPKPPDDGGDAPEPRDGSSPGGGDRGRPDPPEPPDPPDPPEDGTDPPREVADPPGGGDRPRPPHPDPPDRPRRPVD